MLRRRRRRRKQGSGQTQMLSPLTQLLSPLLLPLSIARLSTASRTSQLISSLSSPHSSLTHSCHFPHSVTVCLFLSVSFSLPFSLLFFFPLCTLHHSLPPRVYRIHITYPLRGPINEEKNTTIIAFTLFACLSLSLYLSPFSFSYPFLTLSLLSLSLQVSAASSASSSHIIKCCLIMCCLLTNKPLYLSLINPSSSPPPPSRPPSLFPRVLFSEVFTLNHQRGRAPTQSGNPPIRRK